MNQVDAIRHRKQKIEELFKIKFGSDINMTGLTLGGPWIPEQGYYREEWEKVSRELAMVEIEEFVAMDSNFEKIVVNG